MKSWWYSATKDYLTFSKRERTAIIIGIVLGIALLFLPGFVKPKKQVVDKKAFVQELAQLKISVDSSNKSFTRYDKDDDRFDYYQPKKNSYDYAVKGELFPFDPNTLDANGWKRLGVRDKTVQTIQNFLAKGYKFRKSEDIKKIYGLKPDQANRLVPYVQIAAAAGAPENTSAENKPAYTNTYTSKKSTTAIIDINEADTSAFMMLPGIGSKTATRIINFRKKLGGFTSVAQLGQTYGLPDSTFKKIQQQLKCNPAAVQTININTADAAQLKAHPYLNWNIANAIISYRQQHGNFKAVGDIMKINIITDELFAKISPYLSI